MSKQGKLYKILEGGISDAKSKPISIGGQPFFSEGFIVEFFKDDGTSWIGNFARQGVGSDAVYEYSKNNRVVVYAGGQLYVMDPNSSKPIEVLGYNKYNRLVAVDNSNSQVVMYNYNRIIIIEPTGELWISDKISLDGFKDLKVENNLLTGFSFDYYMKNHEEMWIPFSLNLVTKEIIGGTGKKYGIVMVKKPKKSWWKMFWK